MKVITWNVNGVRARETQLLELVQREAPEVLALQEVKASPEQVPAALRAVAGYACYWHGFKGYSGVALLLAPALLARSPTFSHPAFDAEHRIVVAELGSLTIASIYVPNGNRDYPAKVRFLEALDAWVGERLAAGRELLLLGDLNVAREPRDVHPALRKPTQIGQTPEEQALLARILERGLVDLGRQLAPHDDRLFTWWAPWRNLRARNIGWRLDYVLASPGLAARAEACTVGRDIGTSDHGPVTALFREPDFIPQRPSGTP